MNGNIITRWIDLQNEKLCLKISSTYYRKVEAGHTIYYIFNPRFYPFLLLRVLIVLINFFRFNSNLYLAYKNGIRINSFAKKEIQSSFLTKIFNFFFVFSGLRYFVKPVYEPSYYHEQLQDNQIEFFKAQQPVVSIIIPVFNQIQYTLTCLKSLILNISAKYSYEVIVVDDCSNDDTASIIAQIKGMNYLRNEQNIGFLSSCIKGIEVAKGKYICLLNNDTIVLANWLEALIETIENDANVGCVGSKLIYPYGLLQEAGGIIYSDGSGINYGKYQNARYSKYNYKRKVDYCSGASLLFKREDYDAIGGLDRRYEPAYYEDTDLCFSFRQVLGKDVLYQPASHVVHFEGISSGKKAKKGNVKSYQGINKIKFVEKWQGVLKETYAKCNQDLAARRYLPKKTIMVIDSYLPFFDRESGSNRLFHLLKIFKNLGYHLIFIPNDSKIIEPYYSLLTSNMGIEVITKERGFFSFMRTLKTTVKTVNILWICRPKLNKKYKFLANYNPLLKWFYDTVDLHYIRQLREYNLFPTNKLRRRIKRFKNLEISLAKQADCTIAITDIEAETLKSEHVKNVEIIPNIHTAYNLEVPRFNVRHDLCFIGGYNHTPNVDAALWLIQNIMPLVWKANPDIKLFLLGNKPTSEMLAYQNERIIIPGFIEDVSEYFLKCTIFVSPLRYGAGMKGKIGQSLGFGLPIVSTSIGTEGMGLSDGFNVLEADDATNFAEKILLLYHDEQLWNTIHQNSKDTLEKYTPEVISKTIDKLFQS